MKQQVVSYLSTIKNDIFNLSKYLYENPEKSFFEVKSCNYIVEMLKSHNFKVKEKYMDMDTAFYAEYGSGHPKICYLCEYDAAPSDGHITGHNLISAMSLAAALGLSQVTPKIGGSVIVIGCPGEFLSGAKVTLARQGAFDDIDVVLMAHPHVITAESGTSMAILPLKIQYNSDNGFTYNNPRNYSALDACIFTFNSLSLLSKGLPNHCSVDGVIVKGGEFPNLIPKESEGRFYIRTPEMSQACAIEKKIRDFVSLTSDIMGISSHVSLYELPYDELIPNKTLSRIFAHNLKESGIIEIHDPYNAPSGLSLGNVSHIVPCIHPYISIVEDPSIQYASTEFALATISDFAIDKVMKAAQALAVTGVDLIENKALLQEIKEELHKNNK